MQLIAIFSVLFAGENDFLAYLREIFQWHFQNVNKKKNIP